MTALCHKQESAECQGAKLGLDTGSMYLLASALALPVQKLGAGAVVCKVA